MESCTEATSTAPQLQLQHHFTVLILESFKTEKQNNESEKKIPLQF